MSRIETNNVVERLVDLTAEDHARLAWIKAELEDEPNRPLYGMDGGEPCRNGHEVAELLLEQSELELRAARFENQSLSDRIDVLEGENRQLKIDRLTILAMVYHIAPATVAKMCDEQLDRSGALLGEVREIDRRASLTQGGKTNV